MMKRLFLLIACFSVCMGLVAQDVKITISSATTSSYHNGEGADKAIDGEISTIWHSGNNGDGYNTTFPVTFTITFGGANHVNYVRYVPRTDGSNGNWEEVKVEYCSSTYGSSFETVGTFDLGGSGSSYDFYLNGDAGVTCGQVRFTINSGNGGWASAAEIEAYAYDIEKLAAFAQYFTDGLYTQLKPGVTSSNGIADADVKALVEAMLTDAEDYKKFRVDEYEPYMTTATVRNNLKTNSLYNNYENPTGIYLKRGESCIIAVSGIGDYPVGLKIKDWYKSGDLSTYKLHNGLNYITATTEGNVFVDYYTDDFEFAPNVQMHFINAPVLGYWDQATMTNADWESMLAGPLAEEDDEIIIITRSKHAQTAYPVKQWKTYCPANVDSTMTLYQQVQWAERDILGLEKYGRQVKNRQLFYADKSGSMYAGGDASVCGYGDLKPLVTPDAKVFDFWGVGHEWGHNNQMAGFHWTGCGETTNNIPASWAQFKFTGNRDANGNPTNLRLEDEVTGINDYKGMRGGRMQTYFEEGLRKGVQWQLQDGPDWHAETPQAVTVTGRDENGNDLGQVNTTWRHYDHFVKLAPFWQLNLWGTVANKNPYIITKVIEAIRATDNYTSTYNTNGKQQINWMKLACQAAEMDLLPFFEKAGMLRPIHAYVDDYAKGWNIITEGMINEVKTSVAAEVAAGRYKAYPDEEINYINGHNYHIYRDKLKLNVASMQGTLNGDKVKIQHSVAQNAVAFETYNVQDELIRITMYGLGSDDAHSYTQVLFPSSLDNSQDAAYIMAVGYNGDRQEVYRRYSSEEDALEQRLGRLLSYAKALLDMEDATLTKVGYYKAASLTELKSIYNTTKEVYENKTSASYAEVYNQLLAEYEAIVNDEDARIGVVEGYAYRLTNKEYEGRAMSINNEKMIVGETAALSDAQKWYFEAATTDGYYYIMNKSTQTYPGDVQTSTKLYADKTTKSEAHAYKLQSMGNGLWALVGGTALHQGSYVYNYGIVGWGADAAASQWYITAVEKTTDVTALTLSEATKTVVEGEIFTLVATVTPEDVTDKTVIWSSSNTAVATVDANGKVTARAPGTATITATAGEKTATCEVTVQELVIPVTSIALDRDTVSLVAGERITLVATIFPDNASDKSVTWSSSKPLVAVVNAKGRVSAVGAGTAYIIAKVGAVSDTCVVIVSPKSVPVESIILSETNVSLVEGESATLIATVTPDNATDKTVTWRTSDANVATVEDGVVTAKSAGTATITASAGNREATCEVTVYVPGDVNNDGLIAINDVVITVNKVLGITADNFVFAAADMDGDGEIKVNDVVMVINAVLGYTSSRVQATRSMVCEAMTAVDTDYGFSLSASNATDYVGMQLDMIIPEGISLKDIQVTAGSNHSVAVNERLDGVVRVIVTSLTNDAFGLSQLLDVYVSADRDATVQLTNVYLSTQSGALVNVADEEIVVFRTATDIQVMEQPTSAAVIYDLNGRQVKQNATSLDGLQKGVYLMNGKKIMVK